MQLQYPRKNNGMYYLRTTDFDSIAEMVLQEYCPNNLETPSPLPIDRLAQECLCMEIKPAYLSHDRSIYGATVFKDGLFPCLNQVFQSAVMEVHEGDMLIERQLLGRESHHHLRFTKAHEAGHWILHRPYHDDNNQTYEFRKAKNPYVACRQSCIERLKYGKMTERTDDEWEEWQADHLAASLLMPRDLYLDSAKALFRKNCILCGYLVKGENRQASYQVINGLSDQFDVSYTAAMIRLHQMGCYFECKKEAADYNCIIRQ